KPTDEQLKREKEFRQLLTNIRSIKNTNPKEQREPLVIDKQEDVAKFMREFRWVEVPVNQRKLEKSNHVVELTAKDGKKITLTFLDSGAQNERAGAGPLPSNLLEVSGFGQVWIDDQWKYKFSEHAYKTESFRKAERNW